MVKAEVKMGLKSTASTTQDVPEKDVKENVSHEEEESSCKQEVVQAKPNSKICLFSSILLFLTVTFFIIAIWFKNKQTDRSQFTSSCIVNSQDSVEQLPLWRNVSWEAKEELVLLHKMFGSENILSLRPIYRKDLPENYIAYWEVLIAHTDGNKYIIISAGKETGDRRFVEEGFLPCPTDQLILQAKNKNHRCDKFYRLTQRGDMICEDLTIGRVVAATRNIQGDSQKLKWYELDDQVKKALPRLKREWKKLANKVLKSPEWDTFQIKDSSVAFTSNQYNDNDNDEDLQVTEIGLQPGESAYIPVSSGFRYVKVKFTGLGKKRKRSRRKQSFKRWQKKLCTILCEICDSKDNTRIRKDSIWVSNKGEKYVRFSIHSDKDFVKRELEDQQVQFQFELRTSDSNMIVINYGVVLQSTRVPREVRRMTSYSIPYMSLFPEYTQHTYEGCDTGSAAVAWAMIFGYYDNVAHMYPKQEYSKKLFKSAETDIAPLNMTSSARSFIETIYNELGSTCTGQGGTLTSFSKVKRIEKWFRRHQGRNAYIYTSMDRKEKNSSPTKIAIDLIKSGIPVIISKDQYFNHFSVVTQLRQRSFISRKCTSGNCLPWSDYVVSEFFTHQGWGGKNNRWQSTDVEFVAAAKKD